MSTIITEEVNVDTAITRSPIDGRIVIEIDAQLDDPDEELRIFLNDGPIWVGAPDRDNSALATLEKIDALVRTLRGQLDTIPLGSSGVLSTLETIDEHLSDHRGHGI